MLSRIDPEQLSTRFETRTQESMFARPALVEVEARIIETLESGGPAESGRKSGSQRVRIKRNIK